MPASPPPVRPVLEPGQAFVPRRRRSEGVGGEGGTPTAAARVPTTDPAPQPPPLAKRGIPTPARRPEAQSPQPQPDREQTPKKHSTVPAAQQRLAETALANIEAIEHLAENAKDEGYRLRARTELLDRTPGMAKGTVVSVEHRFVTDPAENHEALRRALAAAGAIDVDSWPTESQDEG